MYYHLLDTAGNVILSNLPLNLLPLFETFNKNLSVVICNEKKYRVGKKESEKGVAFLASDDKEILKTSRVFNEKLTIYSDFLSDSFDLKSKIIDELFHNLPTLVGHNIQEIHFLVPEDVFDEDFSQQPEHIKSILINNLELSVVTIVKIIKNYRLMKAEMDNIRMINGISSTPLLQKHPIHKVLQNIIHIYWNEFQERKIFIKNSNCNERISIDYDSLQGALIPVFNNFVKYVKPNSTIVVYYEWREQYFVVWFEMVSVKVEQAQYESIFQKGVMGKESVLSGKSGSGLGMYQAREFLKRSHANIKLFSKDPDSEDHFARNVVEIIFLKP